MSLSAERTRARAFLRAKGERATRARIGYAVRLLRASPSLYTAFTTPRS